MVKMNSSIPDLQGRRGPSRATYWMVAPLVAFGLLRLTTQIAQEFSKSPEQGARALLNVGLALLGVIAFTAVVVLVFETVFLLRSRKASGTKNLILMNLSVDSYKQAFEITGKPIFHPKWDQGVYVALRHNAIELYAGYKKYTGPRMRIAFADIRSIQREEVRIFGGTAPGIVIDTKKGPLELGFVNNSVIRVGRVRKRLVVERIQKIESAWERWKDQQEP